MLKQSSNLDRLSPLLSVANLGDRMGMSELCELTILPCPTLEVCIPCILISSLPFLQLGQPTQDGIERLFKDMQAWMDSTDFVRQCI